MRISARCEYACRAILELCLHWPDKIPLRIEEIAKKQNIPMKYLVQILIQLKRMNILASVRGKRGGYYLNVSPVEINLGKVLREIGGPLLATAGGISNARFTDVFNQIWDEMESAMSGVVDGISFEEIRNRSASKDKTFFYEI